MKIGCGGFIVLGIIAVCVMLANGPPKPKPGPVAGNSGVQSDASTPRRVLPGLTGVDLHGNLTSKGFKLETLYGDSTTPGISWHCTSTQNGCDLSAAGSGSTASELQSITASVSHRSAGDPLPVAREFLGYIATLEYDGSKPAEAREWVRKHIPENDATTTIGPVRFTIKGTKWARILIMEPAKPN